MDEEVEFGLYLTAGLALLPIGIAASIAAMALIFAVLTFRKN